MQPFSCETDKNEKSDCMLGIKILGNRRFLLVSQTMRVRANLPMLSKRITKYQDILSKKLDSVNTEVREMF